MKKLAGIWLSILLAGTTGRGLALGGDFTLTADDGSQYSLHDSAGKVVVLSFGYTFCPDICPTALATVANALNGLTAAEADRVEALFISLDPDRDTPERLHEYTRFFHPKLRGLTGSAERLHEIAERYRVRYDFVGKSEREHYSLDHSASLYLIDGSGELFRILPHGLPPRALLESVRLALRLPARPRSPLE
jgi:protein SCO1/2